MIDNVTRFKAIVHYTHYLQSLRKVARIYNISKSSLHNWLNEENKLIKKQPKRSTKTVRQDVTACLKAAITANPFATCNELAGIVSRDCRLARTGRTLCRYLKAANITRKKAHREVDHTHDNPAIVSFCKRYQSVESDHLVCIDEAGFYVGDAPRRGWAPRGERLSFKSCKTLRRVKLTLLMAVSATGIVHYEILDHNCKKADFVGFINMLPLPRDTTLVLDNVRFHHSIETVQAAKTKGFSLLHIPPYSPKMNAIENVFGMLKARYRKRCPLIASKTTDYKDLLVQTLNATQQFSAFFQNTLAIVAVTLQQATEDPEGFRFCGYESKGGKQLKSI